MPKKMNLWNRLTSLKKMDMPRALVFVIIIVYLFGLVPGLKENVRELLSNVLVRTVFLGLVILVGYFDRTIGVLLALAFVFSYMFQSPRSFVQDVMSGTQDIISGAGSGAQKLVGGAGSGAQHLVKGVGEATSDVIGGLQSGTQSLVSGVGSGAQNILSGDVVSGAQDVVGGAVGGIGHVVGGVGSGAQELVGGVGSGASELIGGIDSGVEHAVYGLQSGVEKVLGGGDMLNSMSVSQAYDQHMRNKSECSNDDLPVKTGCETLAGYNTPVDCGQDKSDDCLCKGVDVFSNEMNTQGLSSPQGFSGSQTGSTF